MRVNADLATVEKAKAEFWKSFPHTKTMRDAITHETELTERPSEWKKHASDAAQNFYFQQLNNDTLSTTGFRGRKASQRINHDRTRELDRITEIAISSLRQQQ